MSLSGTEFSATNTTYSAGTNMSLSGTEFSATNTTYSAGANMSLNGTEFSATNTVYTHPNHSGEVTSTNDGATVIANNVVDEANLKVSNSPTNGYILTAQSGNTGGLTWAAAASGGVTSLSAASNSGLSVNASTGAVTVDTTGNLAALDGADTISSISVDFLEADVIVADHIEANTIESSHLSISADSGDNRIEMDGDDNVIKIYASGVLRVKIGNLA
jgi:hypothetical protein